MTTALARARAFWRGLEDVPAGWGPCVVTLGVFDGVHCGHAGVIDHAVRTGESRGLPTVLVTFDPHPARVVGAPRDTSVLTTVERRAELVHDLGVAAVLVLPFTRELARVPAGAFVDRVLADGLRAGAVVVGSNFTFGHRGAGTVRTLRERGRHHGFSAHAVPLLRASDAPCSATYIRECLHRGDIPAANRALGRPHRIDGHCDSSGRLHVRAGTAVPAAGLYTTTIHSGRIVDARVTPDGEVLPDLGTLVPGPMSIEFLQRRHG